MSDNYEAAGIAEGVRLNDIIMEDDYALRWQASVDIEWTWEQPSRTCPGGGSYEIIALNEIELEFTSREPACHIAPVQLPCIYLHDLESARSVLDLWGKNLLEAAADNHPGALS